MNPSTSPLLAVEPGEAGVIVKLSGHWTALTLALDSARGGVTRRLRQVAQQSVARWDLSRIERLDHIGAQALWHLWERRLPAGIELTPTQRGMFERIAVLDARRHDPPDPVERVDPVTQMGLGLILFVTHLRDGVALFGEFVLDLLRFIMRPTRAQCTEISAHIFHAGARALPITALVAFMIGIVISYLSALQLSAYGASSFIVNILGLSILRELGPVLAAVLIAGRSGSAITAQLGVMRVTEELDAMRVMGISLSGRLVFPRVFALAIAMPLLVLWTDAIALLGGMVAAHYSIGIQFGYFWRTLPTVVQPVNLTIGLVKGVIFGMLVALVACHFGLRIEPNTKSLGAGTTASVVASITTVIFADAVFAILLIGVGMR